MRTSIGGRIAVVVCALCVLISQSAYAVDSEEEVEKLGAEGKAAYDAGRLVEAQTKLQRAFTLSHYPTVGVWLARALEALGRTPEAYDVLLNVESKPLAAGAPRLFQEAQATARAERTRLSKSVGLVQLQLQGAPPEDVQLTVNGQHRDYPAGGVIAVASGTSVIEGTAGSKRASQTVSAAAGQTVPIVLDLTSAAAPSPPPPAALPATPTATTPPTPVAEVAPSPPVDEAPPSRGFELGGRLVLGIPFGKSVADGDAGKWAPHELGVGLDANYRLDPHWAVGAFLQLSWGIDSFNDDICSAGGLSCSSWTRRLGVQAQYRVSGDRPDGAWVGADIGYEWTTNRLHYETFDATVGASLSGVELLGVQGGYDWRLGRLQVGPAATLTIGRFGQPSGFCEGQCAGVNTTADKQDGAFHFWFFLGGRVTYRI